MTRIRWFAAWTAAVALPACLPGTAPAAAQEAEWRQARPDYVLQLPADHASHPDYRIEWWYYTGNLTAAGGRRFGYQVTFFRVGVDARPANPSRWAVRDLHMAHLALTDVDGGRHLTAERLNRAGVGWAGAATDTLEVWNEEWRVNLEGATHRLQARENRDGFGVDLRLTPAKPAVAHGRDGFSRKGAQPGNASHYYSLTRLATRGRLFLDGEALDVEGLSWMDHEFGTSFLEPSQQGWDWFSLQLDDDTELMVYVLRQRDGSIDPHSAGTLVDAAGRPTALAAGDFRLVPGRTWSSPASGAAYPVAWRVAVPDAGLELRVEAAVDSQELSTGESTGVTYWEGAVVATGTREGRPVQGRGYLEMTGYAGPPMSEVLRQGVR